MLVRKTPYTGANPSYYGREDNMIRKQNQPRLIECQQCNGKGTKQCFMCDGRGYYGTNTSFGWDDMNPCEKCSRRGWLTCKYCDNGYVLRR